ncbi:class I SAM-dependent methyltransferase [Ichthyenterobacterium sp. W332]|uniref:Class I SAM-dependent methyltransferase n=1 Tax=Microcosmobacter mediterraneus TaxID=3075607 RepID=A0ABU2YME5_9FLAO|nr:class I SAM-dependent methyltransferase [Ichthyenterobacterium sp. W332]MDT0559212.1 class I SAM-dependent methyltransferase [Ichthyenterobacterium sp. W332]
MAEAKYNTIGNNYNITRRADPYLTKTLYQLLNPKPKKLYLDIGCGTGNYTNALYTKGVSFIGVDPSSKMLNEAKIKHPNIYFRIGTSEVIPLDSNSIDGCIATLTLHHWNSLKLGFSELFRVLKPNSNLVVFTSTPQQMEGYWLNHYFPKMLKDSMKQMPTFEIVREALIDSGLTNIEIKDYSIKPDLQDLFLYSGKHNPELYFNESVRQGISSFSSLANKKEVEDGLLTLRRDIDSGKIGRIINHYKNDNGDYLFIKAKK